MKRTQEIGKHVKTVQ